MPLGCVRQNAEATVSWCCTCGICAGYLQPTDGPSTRIPLSPPMRAWHAHLHHKGRDAHSVSLFPYSALPHAPAPPPRVATPAGTAARYCENRRCSVVVNNRLLSTTDMLSQHVCAGPGLPGARHPVPRGISAEARQKVCARPHHCHRTLAVAERGLVCCVRAVRAHATRTTEQRTHRRTPGHRKRARVSGQDTLVPTARLGRSLAPCGRHAQPATAPAGHAGLARGRTDLGGGSPSFGTVDDMDILPSAAAAARRPL